MTVDSASSELQNVNLLLAEEQILKKMFLIAIYFHVTITAILPNVAI
jgi:hypothetical protein